MLMNWLCETKLIAYILLLLAMPISTVCQAESLSLEDQLDDAIKADNMTDYSDVSSRTHYTTCYNLKNLKKFSQFDNCMVHLERRHIKNGELTLSAPFVGDSTLNKDYTNASIYGMYAEASLARSDLDKAYEYALIALEGIEGVPTYKGYETVPSYVALSKADAGGGIYGVLAVVEGIRGNKDKARGYINSIENIDFSCNACSQRRGRAKSWLARAYFAVGNYSAAYQALTNEELNTDDVLQDLGTAINYINPAYYLLKGATGFDMGEASNLFSYEHEAMICRALYLSNKAESYSCYQNILKNEATPFFGGIEFIALQDMGNIELRAKEYSKAEATLAKAIELLETQRSSLSSDTHRMGFVGDKLNVYLDMVTIKLTLGKNVEAFEYAERAKSRALVDLLASKKDFSSKINKSKINKLLFDLEKAEQDSLDFDIKNQVNGNTRSDIREKQTAIRSVDANLASLVTVSRISSEDIQDLLGKDETLLEYYGKGEDLFAFILTDNTVEAIKLNGSNIDKLVNEYRMSLSDPNSHNYKKTAAVLYNAVVKPVMPYLNTTHLTIVPHGALHYAPFAALYNGNDFLIDNFQLRVLPSASVLTFLNNSVVTKNVSMLSLGNPDLGNPSYDLPGAEKEALQVAELVPGSKVLLRKKATETALRAYGPEFKQIHFAMHGKFDDKVPLDSRLMLAADAENDGNLTVSELYELQLNTDLVTLSACQTALGETASGDDVVGFTRGFLYAGAQSIVSSLWEVADKPTAYMMVEFYRNLKKYKKAEALRKAQISTRKKFDHPLYWAAFQLTGAY